jgi:hypothetical protein
MSVNASEKSLMCGFNWRKQEANKDLRSSQYNRGEFGDRTIFSLIELLKLSIYFNTPFLSSSRF